MIRSLLLTAAKKKQPHKTVQFHFDSTTAKLHFQFLGKPTWICEDMAEGQAYD